MYLRPTPLSLSLLLLSGAAAAQMQEGDILLNNFTTGRLQHYRPHGQLVAESPLDTTSFWLGATWTPDGNWITTYRSPVSGAKIFDPLGNEILDFPTHHVGFPGDVNVFSDGTIAIIDQAQFEVELYNPQGAHLGTVPMPFAIGQPFGAAIDANDEMWICDRNGILVYRVARDGTQKGVIATGPRPADVDFGPDGTIWTIHADSGAVERHTRGGTLISVFQTIHSSGAFGITVAPDGSVWVSSFISNELLHYDETGTLLDFISVGPGTAFLSIWKGTLGEPYCSPGNNNSSGVASTIEATGTSWTATNDVTLHAANLPDGEFGFFLVGAGQGTFQPPGSAGTICLAGSPIGRYNRPAEIIQGPVGSLTIDLTSLRFSPPLAVLPGDTWNFQCWHRDGTTSNFTDAVSILFY